MKNLSNYEKDVCLRGNVAEHDSARFDDIYGHT